MTSLATRVFLAIRVARQTLATAESLTGGHLAALITDVPGASDIYLGGVVSYATELKVSLLQVPQEIVDEHGVVSAECAAAMAKGIRGRTGAHWALATTGVAGPAEQEGKPVGTVYVGLAGPGRIETLALDLEGDRASIQAQTCEHALAALERALDDQVRRESQRLG